MNREEVIKALECLAWKRNFTENPCYECGYYDRPDFGFVTCVVNVATDAIALLKEQEYENKKAYDNGYVKGFHDAKTLPDCEHANRDGTGCLGYCGCEQDDEPIDTCKQCEKYTGNISGEY